MSAEDCLRILDRYRRIVMVGLSANPMRPSHFAAIYMLSKGYDIVPVNPREKQILGRTCYASVRDVPGPVEIVEHGVIPLNFACPNLIAQADGTRTGISDAASPWSGAVAQA